MTPVYKPFQELKPEKLDGISEEQIAQHWKLYEGYVKNVNTLNAKIAALAQKQDFGPEFAELKRRLGFEYNGMILHEYYFALLKPGVKELGPSSELVKQLKRCFGGFDAWKREFTGIGQMRGVGWAILYYDPSYKILTNHWISIHEEGHPAGFIPVLVMDVWEHAYMVDWGAGGRSDYISAFFKNVDWEKIEENFKIATQLPSAVVHISGTVRG